MKRITSLLAFTFLLTNIAFAQSQKSTYNHHAAFDPLFISDGGNLIRSANGTPGPHYWQNEADYTVTAKLDTTSKKLTGKVIVHYTNNSPVNLHQLWLQLVWNVEKKNSKRGAMSGFRTSPSQGNGFTIKGVSIKRGNQWKEHDFIVDGTRMQIRLAEPLVANGSSIKVAIKYEMDIPQRGRSSYISTKNGKIYGLAYWYPRMCVFDSIKGWNTLPFLGSEFYLDYGTIDYKVTLPEGMLVAASGKLLNPEDVLTSKELKRLEKAHHSDKTVMIRSKEDLNESATKTSKSGMLTWHFRMKNTRDVAWAASTAFMWDAAIAHLQNGKKTIAMSYYPVESSARNEWGEALNT